MTEFCTKCGTPGEGSLLRVLRSPARCRLGAAGAHRPGRARRSDAVGTRPRGTEARRAGTALVLHSRAWAGDQGAVPRRYRDLRRDGLLDRPLGLRDRNPDHRRALSGSGSSLTPTRRRTRRPRPSSNACPNDHQAETKRALSARLRGSLCRRRCIPAPLQIATFQLLASRCRPRRAT